MRPGSWTHRAMICVPVGCRRSVGAVPHRQTVKRGSEPEAYEAFLPEFRSALEKVRPDVVHAGPIPGCGLRCGAFRLPSCAGQFMGIGLAARCRIETGRGREPPRSRCVPRTDSCVTATRSGERHRAFASNPGFADRPVSLGNQEWIIFRCGPAAFGDATLFAEPGAFPFDLYPRVGTVVRHRRASSRRSEWRTTRTTRCA